MASNSIKILSDEQMLKKFRAQALAQAKRFDISNILPQYERYYEHVIKTSVYDKVKTD